MSDQLITGADIVRRYWSEVYDRRQFDLIPDLIADPTWRHEPGKTEKLSIAESCARLPRQFEHLPTIHMDVVLTIEEGELVCVLWNGQVQRTGAAPYDIAGIEIFRIVDRKIVEIWNSYSLVDMLGHWAPPQSFDR